MAMTFISNATGQYKPYITLWDAPKASRIAPSIRYYGARQINEDGTISDLAQCVAINTILVNTCVEAIDDEITAVTDAILNFSHRAYNSAHVTQKEWRNDD